MPKPAQTRSWGTSTLAIHGLTRLRKAHHAVSTPIVQTSTYTFKDSKAIEDYTKKGVEHYEYGRYGNPTAKIAEQRLADLEGGCPVRACW